MLKKRLKYIPIDGGINPVGERKYDQQAWHMAWEIES